MARARTLAIFFGALGMIAAGLGGDAVAHSARTLYLLHCSGCHGPEGQGEPRADVPPLAGHVGAFLQDPDGRLYITTVGGVTSSGLDMEETARVTNWILETFGGPDMPEDVKPFDAGEIRALRANGLPDTVALRRSIVKRLAAKGIAVPDYPWP